MIGLAGLPDTWTTYPFVFIPGRGSFDLNDVIPTGSGWELMEAADINDRGQITGSGTIDGQRRAFLLTPAAARYPFEGFLQPLENPPAVNVRKAGAAVPVKFRIGGDIGVQVLAAGYPTSVVIDCASSLPGEDAGPPVTPVSHELRYDARAGHYVYVWKTQRSWEGTCRELQVRLADGQLHTIRFTFR